MPIVVPASADAPLCQGDILKGVPFAVTGVDYKFGADTRASFMLVLSRPCKALRDERITVAPVIPFRMPVEQLRSLRERTQQQKDASKRPEPKADLDALRRFLDAIRDGGNTSDLFYLGPLNPGTEERFAAELISFSTVMLPKEAAERSAWIQRHRVATLSIEFARDLHARLFMAFARLGFEDHEWLPSADLEMLINEGQAEVAARQTEVAAMVSAVQVGDATGAPVNDGVKKEVVTRKQALAKAEGELAPFVAERAARAAAAAPPDGNSDDK